MKRSNLLKAADKVVSKDRMATHGAPEDSFKAIASLWGTYLSTAVGDEVTLASHDVAAMMALLKLARIAGNPTHMGNWIDLAGYAT